MNAMLAVVGGYPVTVAEALLVAFAAPLVVALALAAALLRTRGQRGALGEVEAQLARVMQTNAEMQGRIGSLGEFIGARQGDLARLISERLDSVGSRVGSGLEAQTRSTAEQLARLGERLALIDAAQTRMVGMTEAVVSLREVLANKQSRGAFGQGRMEAIVRDGLPFDAFEFQGRLSNNTRPDCLVRMPGDPRPLAVDAKFPLEAFTAFREARDEDARRAAGQRARADIARHVKDIAERYLLPGETQDIALLFVPSESIFADLVEHFDDCVQKAHRARVVIVSPSLLRMAIEVVQTLTRDARLQESARFVRTEVGKLVDDVRRLGERAAKLEQHFRQAQEDIAGVAISAEKIGRSARRIEAIETGDPDLPAVAPPGGFEGEARS
jgi:DNA recombination protein RmuC